MTQLRFPGLSLCVESTGQRETGELRTTEDTLLSRLFGPSNPTLLPRVNDRLSAKLRVWAEKASVDRAIGYAVLTRVWQLLAGPVTALLIALCFQPEEQGVYYVFLSLIGFHTVAELGFHSVIVHLIAHEAAEVTIDESGQAHASPEALNEVGLLFHAALKWFAAVAAIFSVVIYGIGYWMLSSQDLETPWQAPWVALVVVSGLGFTLAPYLATLEGCGQMRVVNRYRFWQALIGNIVVWTTLSLGAGVWVAMFSALTQVAVEVVIIWNHYATFWPALNVRNRRDVYRESIWPLQWRVGLLSISNWIAFSLIVPATFQFAGPVVGGQMGMTWTILLAIQTIASAWMRYRFAEFGQLVARAEFVELDRRFRSLLIVSTSIFAALVVAFLLMQQLFASVEFGILNRLASRLLPLADAALLGSALTIYHLSYCWRSYVRIHREEPYVQRTIAIYIVLGVAFVATLKFATTTTAAFAFLAVITFIITPTNYWIYSWFRAAIAKRHLAS